MSFIEHEALVTSVSREKLQVKIVQTSACAACNAKALCNSSEKRELLIDVDDMDASSFVIGDRVVIVGAESMGMQAVAIAFVIPFVVLITACFVGYYLFDGNEPLAALVSIASLIPTYALIYMMRHKLKRRFSFRIKRNN